MTTTVKVHVNGRYRAAVIITRADGVENDPVIVDGNYAGSPNPSGEYSFSLYHPAVARFDVVEQAVPEAPAAKPE